MGSNSKTRKTKEPVVKGVGGEGSWPGDDSATKDQCAISWEFIYSFGGTHSINVGDIAALLPSSSAKELDVVVNSTVLGQYHDKNEQLIKGCVRKGFVYEGEVTKVLGSSTIAIKLKGNG